ncbi:MAG TPA: EamA/RhaT family transporter [Acidimicrobiia bacterium]
MAAVGLGLLIAAAFGSGDFTGGRASAAAPTLAVLFVAQVCSLAGAAVLAVIVSARVETADVVYGALAGTVNVVGLGLLYRALARHAAGVVAPLTAVVGALVPVAWGLAHGERPSALVLAGITLSIGAAALLARGDGTTTAGPKIARGVGPAVLAGAALGSSLILYAETSTTSGQVPVVAARAAAVVVVGVALLWVRPRASGPLVRPLGLLAPAAGVLDVAATALLVVAVRRALLSVVAPLASLAPGCTVLLALVVSKERLGRSQRAGLAVALVALVCIATG